MENTSYIAISRQAALWRQLEAVSNNLANVNTPAFKGERLMFREYLVETASPESRRGQPLSFVQDFGMFRDMRDGPLTKTDNPLDLAIDGEGYFVVETPDGLRYTRNGHFRLDETGMLVDSEGYALMQAGDLPIIVAPNETAIEIAKDGTVSSENGPIGRIRVVRFDNDQQLRKIAGGVYDTELIPADMDAPRVVQGMVEESNVQPVTELTNMIAIMRHYEGVQKLLDNDNDRQLKAFDVLSQPAKA